MGEYTKGFLAAIVKRMTGANEMSATALQHAVGVQQFTLSRWPREAGSAEDVSKGN